MIGDLHKASAKTKAQLPGTTSQVKKDGEKWASEAGVKVDSMVSHLRFYIIDDGRD
jgi:hypothetical protein